MTGQDKALFREAQMIALALGISPGLDMTPAQLRAGTVKELVARHGITEEAATEIADKAVDELAARLPKAQ